MSRALSRSAGSSSSASSAVESAGELVIPSCGPAAQVGNPWFIKPEPRPPAVREDAHPQHEQRGRRDVHAGQEPTGKPVPAGRLAAQPGDRRAPTTCAATTRWPAGSPRRWRRVQGTRDVGHLQVKQGGGLELRGDPSD